MSKCVIITKNVKACGNEVKSGWTEGFINGATFRTFLPDYLKGEGWSKAMVPMCKAHGNRQDFQVSIPVAEAIKNYIINSREFNEEKENDMKDTDNTQFDLEYEFQTCLAKLEGQPYTTHKFQYGGTLLAEKCDHDDCRLAHIESWHEANADVCCGEDNCNHYYVWLCEHHVAKINNNKEETMMVTSNDTNRSDIRTNEFRYPCITCKGWHRTVINVRDCSRHIVVTKKLMVKDGVLCGNCNKKARARGEKNPEYKHADNDAVKACYASKS